MRFLSGFASAFKHERVQDLPTPDVDEGQVSFITWLLRPERLHKPAVSIPPPREGFLSWLLMPEKLRHAGEESEHAPHSRKHGFVRTLLAAEKLPPAPETVEESRGLWRMLVSREELPRDPLPEKKRGGPSRSTGARRFGRKKR